MQTQSPPAQTHTLDSLRTALVTHKPHLEPVLTTVFREFESPETPTEKIAEQLKTVLERDVTPVETTDARSFTWRNQAEREIVLTIPRAAMQANAPAEAPAKAPVEEAPVEEAPAEETPIVEAAPAEEAASTPAAPVAAAKDTTETDPIPAKETEAAQGDGGAGGDTEGTRVVSLLAELDVLLAHSNLHLMIMRAGERKGERLLSVTVVPQATSDKTDPALLTPINLTGTIPELEDGLPRAIAATHEGNQSIEDAIRELEEAKKEAAAAKKAEAAKTKKGAAKKAAAAKTDEKAEEKKPDDKKAEAKAEEKKVEPAATPMFEAPQS